MGQAVRARAAAITGASGMQAVAFLNKKGGVGKTRPAIICWGAGPEGTSGSPGGCRPSSFAQPGLLGPESARALPESGTIAARFDEAGGPPMEALVRPTAIEGVSLLAGSEVMEDLTVRPWRRGRSSMPSVMRWARWPRAMTRRSSTAPRTCSSVRGRPCWRPMASSSRSRPRMMAPRGSLPFAARSPGPGMRPIRRST